MPKIITKVKQKSREFVKNSGKYSPEWGQVLADIRSDIVRLEELASVVERKIERGDPWPVQSVTPLHQ